MYFLLLILDKYMQIWINPCKIMKEIGFIAAYLVHALESNTQVIQDLHVFEDQIVQNQFTFGTLPDSLFFETRLGIVQIEHISSG